MIKPIDLMIIGAQKAGTTSMLRYLGEHPFCFSHNQKEFSYFTDENEFNEGLGVAFKKYYSSKSFNNEKKIIAKNASLFSNELALKRLKEHSPECKLLLILRNPVERTYSSYLMEKNAGSLKFDFEELPELIIKHTNNDESWGFNFFIDYSLYAKHLTNIYKYFPREQVRVLLYRDFKNNTLSECVKIFNWINVDVSFEPKVFIKHNVTKKTRSHFYARIVKYFLNNKNFIKKTIKKIMPGNKIYKYGEILREINKTDKEYDEINIVVKKFLIDFYKPYNEELEKIIDKDLSEWNL